MKLDLSDQPAILGSEPEVGDVFLNQKGDYWLVVATRPSYCIVLQYDKGGYCYGASRYACHYLERKTRIGKVFDLPTDLKIVWEGFPG